MFRLAALPSTLPLLAFAAVVACGGSSNGPFDGWGTPTGSDAGTGANGDPSGSFGSGSGSQAGQACSQVGSTRSCCVNGTQTCVGNGELGPEWGPCVGSNGAPLMCGSGAGPDAGTGGDGGGGGHRGGFDGGLPPLCTDDQINDEPEILVGYSPANGQTVGAGGQIKVWVNDENAPIIAPNEQVDPTTGAITMPGDRTAKAPDGYLWEPALYIAPQTAENGGTPYFPNYIRGYYNNDPSNQGSGTYVPGMDPIPPGGMPSEQYTGEDIWNVSSLGLPPGTYGAEFVIHDGDDDRGVGCITIVVE